MEDRETTRMSTLGDVDDGNNMNECHFNVFVVIVTFSASTQGTDATLGSMFAIVFTRNDIRHSNFSTTDDNEINSVTADDESHRMLGYRTLEVGDDGDQLSRCPSGECNTLRKHRTLPVEVTNSLVKGSPHSMVHCFPSMRGYR